MLISFAGMQNSIMMQNAAQARLMMNADAMLSPLSFGASQPLSPVSFGAGDVFEMQSKADETKIAVYSRLAEAYEKALAADIKRSTPHYAGLNYEA